MAFLKHPEHNILVGDDGTVIGPSGRILKHRVSCSGYARIVVYTNKKHQSVCVHRLVADVFLTDGVSEQVNHIDGNKLNNRAENLEWCTRKQNAEHAVALGLYKSPTITAAFLNARKVQGERAVVEGRFQGEKHPRAKLTDDTVRRIRAEPKTSYGSAPWNRYGISKVMYRNIRIGKSWSHLPC